MPIGTCDPASRGDEYNAGACEEGPILVEYRYGWDGASVMPSCVGPLLQVRVRNLSAVETWWVHFQGRRGTWRSIDIPPGTDRTFSQAQLAARGLTENTDVEGLVIDQSPDPPTTPQRP